MDNLHDFLDESIFDDAFEVEETNNETRTPTDNDDEVITRFLKLKLETAEASLEALTQTLLEKQRFQDELLKKMENDNKIISEINLELTDPISIQSQWIRIRDGKLILGMKVLNESISSLTDFGLILDLSGSYNFRMYKYEEEVFSVTDSLPSKCTFNFVTILDIPKFDSVSEISIDGVLLFELDSRRKQFVIPQYVISIEKLFTKSNATDLTSLGSFAAFTENILSYISTTNQTTFLFEFINDDVRSVSQFAEILQQHDFNTVLPPYYCNSTLLLQIIQTPESTNLFVVKIYYKNESDINILIEFLKFSITQNFTVYEVEENK